MPRVRAEALGRNAAKFARRVQAIDAALAGVAAGFPVEFDTAGAELPHVTEHENPRSREPGENVDRRTDRIRVRVVGVVDEDRPRRGGSALRPAVNGTECSQAARNGLETGPRGESAGRRRAGVERVVAPIDLEDDTRRTGRRAQIDRAPGFPKSLVHAHLRVALDAEVAYPLL